MFDMNSLLARYDGDAEKLAQAFADELNAELAKKYANNDIKDAAEEVSIAWNDFIETYFDKYDLPDGFDTEDFFVEAESIINILKAFIKFAPYIQLFVEYSDKLKALADDNDEDLDEVTQDIVGDFLSDMNW